MGGFNPFDPGGLFGDGGSNPMDPGGLFGGGEGEGEGGGGVAIIGGGGDPNKDEGPLDAQKAYGFTKPADSQFNQMRKSQFGMGSTG